MALNSPKTPDSFDALAPVYAEHAALPTEAGTRLLERLDGLRFTPLRILELGCADGRHCLALHRRYPQAGVIGLDLSAGMLRHARRRRGWWKHKFELIRADLNAVPLAAGSVDLVFANLSLPWSGNPADALHTARRVLRPGGLFLGSLYGPDTLAEIRTGMEFKPPVLADVQALGSLLVAAGFREPVLDTDWITTTYGSTDTLLAELQGLGLIAGPAPPDPSKPLRELSWEIVSASAWAPEPGQPVRAGQGDEISIPVEHIGRRRRDS